MHALLTRITRRATPAVALATLLTLTAPVAVAKAHTDNAPGKSLLTFYWCIDESAPRYHGTRVAALRDARGHVLARTTPAFRRALIKEGSGVLADGRPIMFDRKVGGEYRFRICKEKYGLAYSGCSLVPYRSAAVDPRLIRIGSKIYIPQLKGARLPDGTIHDGIFVASDRGHFRGRHVDLFVGPGERSAAPFVQQGYGSRSRVTVYVLGRANSEMTLAAR